MVMSATALVQEHPGADAATIRAHLEGNLCRCTGYHNIVRAVLQGAEAMAAAEGDDASLQSLAAARAHAA
jgi:carbon-monoxide dehydrogenase small subunit